MKRIFVLLICLAVIVSFPVLSLAMNDGAVVNNPNPQDRLHLRKEPGASSVSLGKYYNGTHVTILEYRDDGWMKVGVGNKEGSGDEDIYQLIGYMMSAYLAKGDTVDSVKSAMPEYTSASSSWNMYKTPSKNAAYDTYGSGENIRLMGFTATWWHIAVIRDGEIYRTGFVPANSNFRQPQTAVVNNPNARDRLHLRTDHDSAAKSLGKYYNGVKVQVLSYAGGDWAKVRIGSAEGYMMTEYLAFGNDAQRVKSAIPTVRTTKDKVNLREGASLTSRSLGQYALGTSVKVWGICGTWLHVEIGTKSGYVLASMLGALPGEGPGNTSSPVSGKAAKLKADANFRDSAGYTGAVLAYLGKGTKVTVQSQSGDWYYVRIGKTDAYGWILKSLVSIE